MKGRRLSALRLVNHGLWAHYVHDAMKFYDGHVPQAAVRLGISQATLYRWLLDPVFEHTPRAPQGVRVTYTRIGRPKKKRDG